MPAFSIRIISILVGASIGWVGGIALARIFILPWLPAICIFLGILLGALVPFFKYRRDRKLLNNELEIEEAILLWHKGEILRIRRTIQELEGDCRLDWSLNRVLTNTNYDEQKTIGEILGLNNFSANSAEIAFREAGSHSVATTIRRVRGREPYVTYSEILSDIASKFNAELDDAEAKTEEKIVRALFARLSDEQRRLLEDQLPRLGDQFEERYAAIACAAASMAAAQFSGFAVYIMASQLVGAVTAALHITLPFAFYTSMSQAIAVVIGPVGWVVLGTWAIHKIGSPNEKKTIPMVLLVASVRQRLETERIIEIGALKKREQETEEQMKKQSFKVQSLRLSIQ